MYAYRELYGGGWLNALQASWQRFEHWGQIDVESLRIMQKSFGELCNIQQNSRRCKTQMQNSNSKLCKTW